MTQDGRDGRPEDGASDRGREGLPPELRDLDEALRKIRYDPRPGLEDEVLARLSAQAEEDAARAAGRRAAPARRALRAAAVLVLAAGLGLVIRAASGGGEGASPAAGAADREAPFTAERFTLRWGPDARVRTVGSDAGASAGPGEHALRCGRVGDRLGCRQSGPGPARFAAAGEPAVLRDFCCLDYDGGGRADDGVRVVAGEGEAVVSFWIYEDRDGTGSFSDGDLLRTVVDGGGAGREPGEPPGRVQRVDRCCADLDGGPRPDDGIFVLADEGENVALAALYEDVDGDGRLSPGDRLRALRTSPLEERPGPGAGRR